MKRIWHWVTIGLICHKTKSYPIYSRYIYKEDFVLGNLLWLIRQKTNPNKSILYFVRSIFFMFFSDKKKNESFTTILQTSTLVITLL